MIEGEEKMSTDNFRPLDVAPAVYSIMEQMQKMGLTENDLVYLIQKRVRGNITLTQIRETLRALKAIEKNFETANKKE